MTASRKAKAKPMITKVDWDKLTPQQQFDYVLMLEETVDSYVEAEALPKVHNRRVIPDERPIPYESDRR